MGALIGQGACRLLALAREAIDSTRVGANGSLHSAATYALASHIQYKNVKPCLSVHVYICYINIIKLSSLIHTFSVQRALKVSICGRGSL